MTTPLYKLRDYKEAVKFEKEHPIQLRWQPSYKQYTLNDENTQGIWLKYKTDIIGEIILTWKSSNVVVIEKLTVVPEHREQGYGHDLVKLAIDWATESGYEFITGMARKGASWKIFENFGATPVLSYKDWAGTKEEYKSFKLEL